MDQVTAQKIEPLVKTIRVPGEPGLVFELFTTRMGEWWPLDTHSVGREEAVDARVEPGVGGRVYEVTRDGAEHEWGRVTTWEPATRLAFSWYPGLPSSQATQVEITFRNTVDGTEVTLVHDGWAARGADWQPMRANYDSGWDHVLGRLPNSVPAGATTAGVLPR